MFEPVSIIPSQEDWDFSGGVGASYYHNARKGGRPLAPGMEQLDEARRISNDEGGAHFEMAGEYLTGIPWPGRAGWTAWKEKSVDLPPDIQVRAGLSGPHLFVYQRDHDDLYFLFGTPGARPRECLFWGWLLGAEAKYLCPKKWSLHPRFPASHNIKAKFLHPLDRERGLLWPDGTVARPWGAHVTVPLVKKLWPRPDGWPLRSCGLPYWTDDQDWINREGETTREEDG